MKLSFPTGAQVAAFGRHVASYAAGAVTVAVGLHFISPDQGSQIGDAIKGIINGVASIVGGVATLLSIGAGLYASWTASPSSQASAIGASTSTEVKSAPGGIAVVTIRDPAMASAAIAADKKAS
jgi:hypothetical protein